MSWSYNLSNIVSGKCFQKIEVISFFFINLRKIFKNLPQIFFILVTFPVCELPLKSLKGKTTHLLILIQSVYSESREPRTALDILAKEASHCDTYSTENTASKKCSCPQQRNISMVNHDKQILTLWLKCAYISVNTVTEVLR